MTHIWCYPYPSILHFRPSRLKRVELNQLSIRFECTYTRRIVVLRALFVSIVLCISSRTGFTILVEPVKPVRVIEPLYMYTMYILDICIIVLYRGCALLSSVTGDLSWRKLNYSLLLAIHYSKNYCNYDNGFEQICLT